MESHTRIPGAAVEVAGAADAGVEEGGAEHQVVVAAPLVGAVAAVEDAVAAPRRHDAATITHDGAVVAVAAAVLVLGAGAVRHAVAACRLEAGRAVVAVD